MVIKKKKNRIFYSFVYGKIIRIRIIRTDTVYITAKKGTGNGEGQKTAGKTSVKWRWTDVIIGWWIDDNQTPWRD